jgi:hypothetical protein
MNIDPPDLTVTGESRPAYILVRSALSIPFLIGTCLPISFTLPNFLVSHNALSLSNKLKKLFIYTSLLIQSPRNMSSMEAEVFYFVH